MGLFSRLFGKPESYAGRPLLRLSNFRRQNMTGAFCLIDLVSQGEAVQRHLKGIPLHEKLEWLAERGKLDLMSIRKGFPPMYRFESSVGLYCCFFIRDDLIVFIGDNTTFTVDD
ncbi:MAG: hypothetical protein K8T89_16470 [Planctomycetes bacterium]|nr:hypothetical protein [Planctomycetota bacterium]